MQRIKIFYILTVLIFSTSCKEEKKISDEMHSESTISTFYFIRHAEKDRSNPENEDPELNQEGLGRAMHWAEIMDDIELDAVYSTKYERTSMTAAPILVKRDMTIQYYDPHSIDVEQFKVDNANKTVLVVGHSNTTPDFVNKMIGEEKYYEMDDDDNGSLFIVQVISDKTTSQRLHFNCNCPKER